MPIDVALVRRRLRALERYVRVLRELHGRGREAFLSDRALQDRVERNAQLAAQTCIDVALHIIAASGRFSPETYAAALRAIAELGIITPAVAERLAGAARLRNILVHDYLDVDHGRLFDELGWLDDAATFAVAIERWVQGRPPDAE